MYKINLENPVHLHFIGIGGISMSGLAEILLKRNFTISGSDRSESPLTRRLSELGATIYTGQKAENLTKDTDAIVYTAAITENNPEFAEGVRLGIPMLTRAELLGQIMQNYKTAVAVAGTHGKTTVTSMLSEILLKAELDPTISVGGILNTIHGNIRCGGGPVFLTEACEYKNSFLSFFPTIGIILNIEEDHMDFFKDLDDIRGSFLKFSQKIPSDGLLIINADIDNTEYFTEDISCRFVTVSAAKDADYRAKNITFDEQGCASYDLYESGRRTLRIRLSASGVHNVSNSLAVIAAAREIGVSDTAIAEGILAFTGACRRFEHKGEIGGVTIIDDYAHHPTEIRATLNSAKKHPHREIWCVFQPHTYTRTKAFFKDFAEALALADHVVLLDIYAARETDTLGMSSELLAEEIRKYNPEAYYFPSFDEAENFLLTKCMNNDMLITMGAGDIVKLGEHMLGR